MAPSGAIIMGDAPRPDSMLVPSSSRDLKDGLRQLTQEFRAESRELRAERRKKLQALAQTEQRNAVDARSLAVFPDAPSENTFARGRFVADGAICHRQLDWNPPCAAFAKDCAREGSMESGSEVSLVTK